MDYVDGDYAVGGSGKTVDIDESFIGRGMVLEEAEQSEPMRFFSKATRVLVTAMKEAQVKRLICVTGFGAANSRGRGRFLYNLAFHLLLGRVYDDKDVQELILRRSKLDWVIVRPVILTDGPKTNA